MAHVFTLFAAGTLPALLSFGLFLVSSLYKLFLNYLKKNIKHLTWTPYFSHSLSQFVALIISGERGECWLIKKQSVIPKYFVIQDGNAI